MTLPGMLMALSELKGRPAWQGLVSFRVSV